MDDLDLEVIASKTDEKRLNNLIAANQSFILNCAARTTHRFITKSDNEWSVALSAFNEAVGNYDQNKGSFRSFASLVIKRRLLDYIKSQQKYANEIPIQPFEMEGETEEGGEISPLLQEVRKKTVELSEYKSQTEPGGGGDNAAQAEIAAVQEVLQAYGFSFFDLADCSPKAKKTKGCCAQAVKVLLQTPELLKVMRQTKNLPLKELCDLSKVPRKIMERHRKYIIASAEILSGEYPIIGEYLNYIRKALDS